MTTFQTRTGIPSYLAHVAKDNFCTSFSLFQTRTGIPSYLATTYPLVSPPTGVFQTRTGIPSYLAPLLYVYKIHRGEVSNPNGHPQLFSHSNSSQNTAHPFCVSNPNGHPQLFSHFYYALLVFFS